MPEAGDVLAELVSELPLSDVRHEGLRLYVFGSAARAGAAPRDVDLLLVYADDRLEQAHALAGEIRRTLAVPPFDVLAASETETAQLDLIARQQAVQIWPLDRAPMRARELLDWLSHDDDDVRSVIREACESGRLAHCMEA